MPGALVQHEVPLFTAAAGQGMGLQDTAAVISVFRQLAQRVYNSSVPRKIAIIGWLVTAAARETPPQKPAMSDQVFKNVRILKGIPVDEFMATMGFFSASLGETCTDCHSAESGGSWAKYADNNPRKNTARAMIGIMNAINKNYFGGKREITCYSCHRGVERPDVTPNLADLYGPPR